MVRKRISLIVPSKPGWHSGPVLVARNPWSRWRGLRAVPQDRGVLIRTRSVHTFGFDEPIGAVFLTDDLDVLRVEQLGPGRVAGERGARWVLELRGARPLPDVGDRLRMLDG